MLQAFVSYSVIQQDHSAFFISIYYSLKHRSMIQGLML